MSSFKVLVTVLSCVLIAYTAQTLWTRYNASRYKEKVIRNLQTLDEVRAHAKIFDKPEVIKVRDFQ